MELVGIQTTVFLNTFCQVACGFPWEQYRHHFHIFTPGSLVSSLRVCLLWPSAFPCRIHANPTYLRCSDLAGFSRSLVKTNLALCLGLKPSLLPLLTVLLSPCLLSSSVLSQSPWDCFCMLVFIFSAWQTPTQSSSTRDWGVGQCLKTVLMVVT